MTTSPIPPKPEGILATSEQWQAITQRGDNLLVSASAGSGKTKVLVERIMRYIDEGVDVDRLLIVTFTEAAAREMKERLRTNLEKAITKSHDAASKQRYLHQINLLANATISTIHSFCMKVIRRYFYLTQMDPVFSLIDDVEASLLRERVWHTLVDTLLEEDEASIVPLMRYFASDRDDEDFTQLVYRLYDFARSKPYPKDWLASLAEPYQVSGDFGDLTIVKDHLAPLVKQELNRIVEQYDDALMVAEIVNFDKCYQVLLNDATQLQEIATSYASGNYTAAYELATQMTFDRWPTLPKNSDDIDVEAVKALKTKRDHLKDVWTKSIVSMAFFASPSEQVAQLKEMAPIVAKLSQVVIRFYDAYQGEKKRMNKIDFSDLEHDTLAILKTVHQGARIAERHYQDQFIEVLVDEYQDVNRVQEAILTSISREKNRFMVGDVKQSIYAFRLADPSLFREKYEAYATHDGGERIILAENFRSRDEVLSFTNLLFRQIMDPELGQIAYDDAAALKTGNDSYSTDDNDKQTDLYIIEKSGEEEESEDDELTLDIEAPEVHLIASKIQSMMAEGFEIMADDSTKDHPKKRPLRYSDIVILAPTKKNNTTIEEIFAHYQIPVYVQKNQNYFKRTEITTMMSALKMIDNPTQDIPLVAVLRSGMFGLDEVALAHIRKKRTHLPFVDACRAFVSDFQLEDVTYYDSRQQAQLKDKVVHFLTLLDRWRDMANNYPISDLIWSIYLDTQFLAYVHGQSSGSQRVLNLHALYERAKDYEASAFKGLRNFVRFIESMQKKQQDLEEPTMLSDDEDAVRVMTIHASKGLEYPVVFLMDAGKLFNMRDTQQASIRSDEYGLGLKHFDPDHRIVTTTMPYILAQRHEQTKLLSEEMRKLYVALTRAREKLIIVGTKRQGTVEDFEVAHDHLYIHDEAILPYLDRAPLRTYLDWILLATMKDDLPVNFTKTILSPTDVQQAVAKWLVPQQDTLMTEHDWTSQLPQSDIPNLKQLLHTLKQPYKHALASNTASYQSVSEIKRMREEPDIRDLPHLEATETAATQYIYLAPELAKPQFLQQTTAVTAAERGSGLHLLMQQLDFTQPFTYETVQATLDRLVDTQLLERDVAAVVPIDQVLTFMDSPFGRWLVQHNSQLKREQAFSYVVPAKTVFKDLHADNDRLLIHGIIDGYVELADQIILFDYKTDHVVPTEEGIQRIVDKYREQLHLYAEALEASTGKPVTRRMLCLLSIGQNVVVK